MESQPAGSASFWTALSSPAEGKTPKFNQRQQGGRLDSLLSKPLTELPGLGALGQGSENIVTRGASWYWNRNSADPGGSWSADPAGNPELMTPATDGVRQVSQSDGGAMKGSGGCLSKVMLLMHVGIRV